MNEKNTDNGIYILQTKAGNGFEYRVGYVEGIDSLDPTNDYDPKVEIPKIFGQSTVFSDLEKAREWAKQKEKECPYLDYGISWIVHNDKSYNELLNEEVVLD